MTAPQELELEATTTKSAGRARRLALKELRETLRDRRTLFTLLLMPILVYPLLGVVLQKVLFSAVLSQQGTDAFKLGFATEQDAKDFHELLQRGRHLLPPRSSWPEIEFLIPELPEGQFRGRTVIADYDVNVVVLFRERAATSIRSAPLPRDVELVFEAGNARAQELVLIVEQHLQAVNREASQRLLRQSRATRDEIREVKFTPITRQPTGAPMFSLAAFVPLMLILMTVTGAVYPAIDLTAGERERGTLEVLVAAPVPRMELLGAKFVAVLFVAMLTAIVNLTAMLITLYASGLEELIFGTAGVNWLVMLEILALLFLFAGFFSAVLLALTSFARSFKEAQAYLIPLMLVALAPGVFSLTPGLQMNGLLAATPLVNIVLLGRDLLQGKADALLSVLAVVSTLLYALLALTLAARVFGSDAILYGSQGSVKDLFKRPAQPRAVPTITQTMLALAVLFPAFVVGGSMANRLIDLPIAGRLGLSALVLVMLFLGWPVLMAWRNHVTIATGFRLKLPRGVHYLIALVWGLTIWVWVYELNILILPPERLEKLMGLFDQIKLELAQVPLAWKLITLAVVPAVCEEWFFRGYLMSGFRTRMGKTQTILSTAVLFGLFHVIVKDVLFFERFLPTTIMGLFLGWLAVNSGSLWPGMVLHVIHNGLQLTIGAYQEQLMSWQINLESRQHLPWPWLAVTGVLIAAAALVLSRSQTAEQAG